VCPSHVSPVPITRRSCLAAIAGAAGTALVGCGSGASGTNSDGTVDITVIRAVTSTFEPLFVAQDQGYFKAAGLNVTFTTGATDSSQNAPTVIRGDAQFAMTDSGGLIKATAGNLPVQIATSLQNATTKDKPSDGLLVKPGSSITGFTDLAGKTLALPSLGGTLQFICEYSAKQAGIDPSSIKFVALPVASLLDAVTSGKVDAAYTFATYYDAGKAAGMGVIGEGTNALPGLIQALLFTGTAYAKQNPDVVEKFVAAVGKGISYANAHPADVRAIDKKYTKLPASYIARRAIQTFSPSVDTTVLKTMVTDMAEFGMIKSAPKVGAIVCAQAPTTTTSE
jgi:NitT/TauT family transport system substrate-binding protein